MLEEVSENKDTIQTERDHIIMLLKRWRTSREETEIQKTKDVFENGKPSVGVNKKTEMLSLWYSPISGRHACQDVSDWRGMKPRLRCSHNLLSDQNALISSSWWPSLMLLMFLTGFLSFGEIFDLVYSYCPSLLFFPPISLERCKTKENINIRYGQLSPKLLRKLQN